LFYILAALGAIAILVTLVYFPATEANSNRGTRTSFYKLVLQFDLRTLFTAALVSSLVLNLFFFLYPISWTHLGVERTSLWKIYVVALVPSMLFVFPYIRRLERRGNLGPVPLFGYLSMLLGFIIYLLGSQWKWSLYATAALFFLGYTVYQSFVPAFITQRTPQEKRGVAMGFYNLSAFFGSSIGGMVAGLLYNFGSRLPVIAGLVVLVLWRLTGLPRHAPSELTGE
jgi:predicted MFS family arabinose efflux permease